MKAKYVKDSITEQVQVVLPAYINGYGRLFGGVLMQWIDIVAGVVAKRHSNQEVTTVAVDSLEFSLPAYVNDVVALRGTITFTGETSMEVRVDTFVENLDGTRKQINRAYLVLVAIDKEERPIKVPPLMIETPDEKREWENGIRRNNMRKMRRHAKF